jgi:hypothetical protein
MGILQFQLQGGKNYVKIHQSIARTPVRLRTFAAHFNVVNHGFYLARIRFPPQIVGTMNARNNLYDNTEIILSIDHQSSFVQREVNWDLGMINFPASFEIRVDFDSGIQMVPTANTGYRGAVSQNPTTLVWSPSGATGNNQFTTDGSFTQDPSLMNADVINDTLVDDANIGVLNPNGNLHFTVNESTTWVSVGLMADYLSQQPVCPVVGQDAANAAGGGASGTAAVFNPIYGHPVGANGAQTFYNSTTGNMSGFVPFCYSCVLTLEYDGSSTEARVQNLY